MMTISIVATLISSVCMSLMIVTDKLMLNKCYESKPRQAWFVSSLAGSIFGLFLTFAMWGVVAIISPVGNISMILGASLDLFLWQGLVVFLVGIIGAQFLLSYFVCFGEDANPASVAAWIAATPLFILLTLACLKLLTSIFEINDSLGLTDSLNLKFIFGTILATVSLITFEYITNKNVFLYNKYSKHLILLITYSVVYSILLEYTLNQNADKYSTSMYIIALLPYLWLGFATGTRDIFNKNKRKEIFNNWNLNVKKYWQLIILVEIIGMLVFYFEYFGLANLSAVYVSVIIGAHVLIVYLLDLLISKYLHNKHNRQLQISNGKTLLITESNFLHPKSSVIKNVIEVSLLLTTVLGILIATINI